MPGSFPPRILAVLTLSGTVILLIAAAGYTLLQGKEEQLKPSATQTALSDTFDFASLAPALLELSSFHYIRTMKLEIGGLTGSFAALGDYREEGTFVAPNKVQVRERSGPYDSEVVYIGAESWRRDFSSPEWRYDKEPDDIGNLIALRPLWLVPSAGVLKGQASLDALDGSTAIHYHFDRTRLGTLALEICCGEAIQWIYGEGGGSQLAEVFEAELDLWVNEHGVLVKMEADVSGRTERGEQQSIRLEQEITDLNSSSLTVEAPAAVPTPLGDGGGQPLDKARPGQYRDNAIEFGKPAEFEQTWRITVVDPGEEVQASNREPKPGEQRLVVRISALNIGNRTLRLALWGNFRLAGPDAVLARDLYQVDISLGLAEADQCGGQTTGDVEPGEQIEATLCFFVPESETEFQLVWWPSYGRDADLTFFALR